MTSWGDDEKDKKDLEAIKKALAESAAAEPVKRAGRSGRVRRAFRKKYKPINGKEPGKS